MTRSLHSAILGALVLGAVGCAGSLNPSLISGGGGSSGPGTGGTGNTGGTAAPCDAPTMVFANLCAQVGCHNAAAAGGLDLSSAGLVGRLYNKASTGANSSLCGGDTTPYLLGGSTPATGLLLDKLKSSPPCGTTMPQIGTLSATQSTCLNSWATGVTTGVITQ